MNKQEIIKEISDLIELQEKAINQHPVEVVAVYTKGRDSFLIGQSSVKETEGSLTKSEIRKMHLYMLTSSFISACYHLAGDNSNRDKMAHSCSNLLSGLDQDPMLVMEKFLGYEQSWRKSLTQTGAAKSSSCLGSSLILLTTMGGLIIWTFFIISN